MKRFRGIAGKKIGGQVYVHKSAATLVIPEEVLALGKEIFNDMPDSFGYNLLVWNESKNTLKFVLSPDFDTASEPEVGVSVTIDLATRTVSSIKFYKQVYHRKALWVTADYTGFDVTEAEAWAVEWTSRLKETADGSNRENWHRQLTRNGIRVPE